jgi:hypothetical protein
MRGLIARRVRRLRKQGVEVDLGDGAGAVVKTGGTESWSRAPDPVAAAAKDIAALARTAIDLHGRLRAEQLRTSR